MTEIYEALQQGLEIRKNLIELKKLLKEEGALDAYLSMTEDDALIAGFLKDEDAKVRKNAANVLGLVKSQESLDQIWEAYVAETQLFVKSAYLAAMQKLDCRAYERQIKKRYEELLAYEPQEEEKKHIQEEVQQMRRLVAKFDGVLRHKFTGYYKPQDFILTTLKHYQDTTCVQVETGEAKVIPMGVQVTGGIVREVSAIRTYRELLFNLYCDRRPPMQPEEAAQILLGSNLLELLEEMHEGNGPYAFRLEIKGPMTLEEKSGFAKKLATELELRTQHFLVNDTGNYEIEIRLIQDKNGNFFPCLKLFTILKNRFSYRKYTTATSMHPTLAALLVELSSNWLADHAHVLDAFCGTGTLLIERLYALPVRAAFGTDTYGEAIFGARANTAAAHMNINYIQRNFLEFTHGYLFDEIWADMPLRGKKTREEQDAFYLAFFKRAWKLLKDGGRVFVYCNEIGLVKKYIRLLGTFRLKQEFCIREKDGFYLFILEQRALQDEQ